MIPDVCSALKALVENTMISAIHPRGGASRLQGIDGVQVTIQESVLTIPQEIVTAAAPVTNVLYWRGANEIAFSTARGKDSCAI